MADLTGRMIGAMQADVKTFEEIEADPNAMTQAITVIVVASVASLIGNIFRAGSPPASRAGGIARGYALFCSWSSLWHESHVRAGDERRLQRDIPTVGFGRRRGLQRPAIPVVGS